MPLVDTLLYHKLDMFNNNNDEVQHLQAQQANDSDMRQDEEPASPLAAVSEDSISQVMEMAGCEGNQAIRALFMTRANVLEAARQQRGQNSNRLRYKQKTCHAAEMFILNSAMVYPEPKL